VAYAFKRGKSVISNVRVALSLVSQLVGFTSTAEDVARIRPLLPAGSDIAQIQASVIVGGDATEALRHGSKNYLIRDMNGDGVSDILVIAEVNPTLESREESAPCTGVYDSTKCSVSYGQRSLNLYLGQTDGSFRLDFANTRIVLDGNEGGAWGDPLDGLYVTPTGAIKLGHSGGSSDRWGYTEVMQFRGGQFVVIGQDRNTISTQDLRGDSKSINFITGQVMETHGKEAEASKRTRRYRIAVKPLVKVADYDPIR